MVARLLLLVFLALPQLVQSERDAGNVAGKLTVDKVAVEMMGAAMMKKHSNDETNTEHEEKDEVDEPVKGEFDESEEALLVEQTDNLTALTNKLESSYDEYSDLHSAAGFAHFSEVVLEAQQKLKDVEPLVQDVRENFANAFHALADLRSNDEEIQTNMKRAQEVIDKELQRRKDASEYRKSIAQNVRETVQAVIHKLKDVSNLKLVSPQREDLELQAEIVTNAGDVLDNAVNAVHQSMKFDEEQEQMRVDTSNASQTILKAVARSTRIKSANKTLHVVISKTAAFFNAATALEMMNQNALILIQNTQCPPGTFSSDGHTDCINCKDHAEYLVDQALGPRFKANNILGDMFKGRKSREQIIKDMTYVSRRGTRLVENCEAQLCCCNSDSCVYVPPSLLTDAFNCPTTHSNQQPGRCKISSTCMLTKVGVTDCDWLRM